MGKTSGYPGKKKIAAGATKEYVDYQSGKAALDEVIAHEGLADPHPQYTTDAEVSAMLPRFVTFWKWS